MDSHHDIDPEKSILEILNDFRKFDGEYKRAAVDAAIARKDEIVPHLIKILEDLLADPLTYLDNHDLNDHTYAVMLLGHFKEQRAHKVLVDVFSLPDGLAYDLFADMTTEDLPMILNNTCGGCLDDIKGLVENQSADVYCRASAAQALAYTVLEGYATREAVVAYLGTLFTGEEAEEGSEFWGLIAGCLWNLFPVEIVDIIKKGYEDRLIFPGIIGYESFKEALEKGEAWCLNLLEKEYQYNRLDDLHKAMSWWHCFHQDDEDVDFFDDQAGMGYPVIPAKGKSGKEKAKSKKKRKQAKASRKKNRR